MPNMIRPRVGSFSLVSNFPDRDGDLIIFGLFFILMKLIIQCSFFCYSLKKKDNPYFWEPHYYLIIKYFALHSLIIIK